MSAAVRPHDSSARGRILARLAQAVPQTPLPLPDVPAYYRAHTRGETLARRVERFRAALEAAHAEVHPTDGVSWPALLCRIAGAKRLRTLLVGAGAPDTATLAAHPSPGFALVRYDDAFAARRRQLFEGIDAGLSRARSGIAETGSLVLWPDAGEPRLLSLVPPVHFVLLDTRVLHADLHAAMASEGWARGMPTNALLISGPSKTADIQQVLAYGAHGPRELVVLLCHRDGV